MKVDDILSVVNGRPIPLLTLLVIVYTATGARILYNTYRYILLLVSNGMFLLICVTINTSFINCNLLLVAVMFALRSSECAIKAFLISI